MNERYLLTINNSSVISVIFKLFFAPKPSCLPRTFVIFLYFLFMFPLIIIFLFLHFGFLFSLLFTFYFFLSYCCYPLLATLSSEFIHHSPGYPLSNIIIHSPLLSTLLLITAVTLLYLLSTIFYLLYPPLFSFVIHYHSSCYLLFTFTNLVIHYPPFATLLSTILLTPFVILY